MLPHLIKDCRGQTNTMSHRLFSQLLEDGICWCFHWVKMFLFPVIMLECTVFSLVKEVRCLDLPCKMVDWSAVNSGEANRKCLNVCNSI